MKKLEYLALFLSVVLMASAFTGIQSVSGSPAGLVITRYGVYGRIGAIVGALMCAAFAYGLHIRARIIWKAGFVLLALGYIDFVIDVAFGTFRAYPTTGAVLSNWLFIGLVALVGAAVLGYWTIWWKRQLPYFVEPRQISNRD